jgi:hypothetical protein
MNVKVEVGVMQANACFNESKTIVVATTPYLLSYAPIVSDLTFTPSVTVNGGSISSIPADKKLLGVMAA